MSSILIIDDESDLLEMLKIRFSSLPDVDVRTAGDGAQGLEKLSSEGADVVFLDLFMPGIDGFEVRRRIREDERLGKVPVYLMTASPSRDVKERAAEAGFSGVIGKPFDVRELVRIARQHGR